MACRLWISASGWTTRCWAASWTAGQHARSCDVGQIAARLRPRSGISPRCRAGQVVTLTGMVRGDLPFGRELSHRWRSIAAIRWRRVAWRWAQWTCNGRSSASCSGEQVLTPRVNWLLDRTSTWNEDARDRSGGFQPLRAQVFPDGPHRGRCGHGFDWAAVPNWAKSFSAVLSAGRGCGHPARRTGLSGASPKQGAPRSLSQLREVHHRFG